MKVYTEIEQGSDEWKEARRGKPSASHASEIITAVKGDLSKSSRKYIFSLIADCFSTDDDLPEFKSHAMQRGTELEPIARDAFIAETGLNVEEVGLIVADNNICICSPDGLISEGGKWTEGVEIKCPLKETHAEYVLEGVLPEAYKAQVHWSLAVSGLPRWHFWSFHPAFKPLHVVVNRDEYTAKVEDTMQTFVTQYQNAYEKGRTLLYLKPL